MGGATYFGSGLNDETTTPNIRSGKSCYPGKTNPAEMGNASEGGRDGIKVPMEVNTSSKPTKRSDTVAKVPQVGGY